MCRYIFRLTVLGMIWAFTAASQIRVGEPKVYDERSLRQMLASLEATLRELNTIDASKLNVDRIQGSRQNSFSLTLSGTTTPTPSIKDTSGSTNTTGSKITGGGSDSLTDLVTEKPTTTTVHSTSSGTENTTGTSVTTGREVNTPSATATVPNVVQPAAALPSTGPSFGLSASDILDAQVNLSYQITNLRLLLDGAISDRMRTNGTSAVSTLNTVVGFQISIDEQCKKCVAEVDIQVASTLPPATRMYLAPAGGYGQQPKAENRTAGQKVRLVSLMPREKTYNVATVSEKAISIGGAATVGVANIGGSGYWGRKQVYLVKDSDTVARDLSAAGETANFGWQFRPVLGRKTVQGGIRQVFAVLSLPVSDTESGTWKGTAQVTTRWRKYDTDNGIAGAPMGDEATRSYEFEVFPTAVLDRLLGPRIDGATLEEGAGGKFGVTVIGANFGGDIAAQAGDARVTGATGLIVESNRISFVVGAADLVASPLSMIGRYGASTRVIAEPSAEATTVTGLKITSAEITPLEKDMVTVKLHVKDGDGKGMPNLHKSRPLVLAGGKVFGTRSSQLLDLGEIGGEQVSELVVAAKDLRQFPEIAMRLPLWPESYASTYVVRIPHDFTADMPVLLSAEPTMRRYAITGSGLVAKMTAELDTGAVVTLTLKNPQLLVFEAPPARIAAAKYLILAHPTNGSSALLKLPPAPALPPEATGQDALKTGDIKTFAITGVRLDKVFEVQFDGKPLTIDPKSDEKNLLLLSTKELTATAGLKELHLYSSTGDVVKFLVKVDAR